jgi:hypothetical protein
MTGPIRHTLADGRSFVQAADGRRTCVVCERWFVPEPDKRGLHTNIYCDNSCQARWAHRAVQPYRVYDHEARCEVCGAIYRKIILRKRLCPPPVPAGYADPSPCRAEWRKRQSRRRGAARRERLRAERMAAGGQPEPSEGV